MFFYAFSNSILLLLIAGTEIELVDLWSSQLTFLVGQTLNGAVGPRKRAIRPIGAGTPIHGANSAIHGANRAIHGANRAIHEANSAILGANSITIHGANRAIHGANSAIHGATTPIIIDLTDLTKP